MGRTDLTKKLLSNTLAQLLLTKPIDKITVQNIIDTSGLSRKTFYYHFTDKQDLVCWTFEDETKDLWDTKLSNNRTITIDIIRQMHAHKKFYLNVFNSTEQNSLKEYLYKICYQGYLNYCISCLDGKTMPAWNLELIASYFTTAVIDTVIDWLQSGKSIDLYVSEFSNFTQECLEFAVSKYSH